MISSENAGNATVERKFPYAVLRKGIGNNSILYNFCRCWMHKGCSGIKGNLKNDSKFKYQA